MKPSKFRNRHFVNLTIAWAVLLHIISLMMAARFEVLWLTQFALRYAAVLYLILGPIFWLWHRTTRPTRQLDGLSDIRKAMADMEDLPQYDPQRYFDIAKGLFVGLDIDRRNEPVYAPWKRVRKTHMQVVGASGFGKGVATTMMLWQCALAGECVVIFDPKWPGDEFAPAVLHGLAQAHNIPFYFLNLSPLVPEELQSNFTDNPPQFNLFAGCSAAELEAMLNNAFGLEDSGDNAAHYRLHDRLAAKDICKRVVAQTPNPTIQDLLAAADQSPLITDKKGEDLKANLTEISDLAVLNTTVGLDLKAILEQNAILYIIGDTEHPGVVRLQKMVLLRLTQIIRRRNRLKQIRKTAMMLDELPFLLSTGAVVALGTVRDKGCHIFLAHQTLEDLRRAKGLDPIAVSGAVKGNTTLKLIYRITDDDTGKWASNLSGTIVVRQQSSHMQQGMFHAAEGQFREIERPLLDLNELLSLPDLTGMFWGAGISRRIQVSPLPKGSYPTLEAAPALLEITPIANSGPKAEEICGPMSQSSATNSAPDAEPKPPSTPESTLSNPDPF
jgi:hypothetical protein